MLSSSVRPRSEPAISAPYTDLGRRFSARRWASATVSNHLFAIAEPLVLPCRLPPAGAHRGPRDSTRRARTAHSGQSGRARRRVGSVPELEPDPIALTREQKAERAGSFGGAAAQYERYRQGPPAAAVDWVLPTPGGTIVDLGAGT